jgi:hypothetical protein
VRIEPPVKVTEQVLTIDVREIEPLLQAPPMDMKPFPDAMVKLKDGRTLYIREAKLEEAPMMLEHIKKYTEVEHDFYDIVGARVYYVTKKYWDTAVKTYIRQMVGSELDFNVPDSVKQANAVMRAPDDITV